MLRDAKKTVKNKKIFFMFFLNYFFKTTIKHQFLIICSLKSNEEHGFCINPGLSEGTSLLSGNICSFKTAAGFYHI